MCVKKLPVLVCTYNSRNYEKCQNVTLACCLKSMHEKIENVQMMDFST